MKNIPPQTDVLRQSKQQASSRIQDKFMSMGKEGKTKQMQLEPPAKLKLASQEPIALNHNQY